MSDQKKEVQLQGIVHASRYDRNGQGKSFLGAGIECSDGRVWVISYSEESPFHAFAGRQVVVSGEPYEPEYGSQSLIGWEGKKPGHFCVSTMRLVEVTPDAELVEVGAGQHFRGRFERGKSKTGKSILFFVTEDGETFPVANNPAGASVGPSVEVLAYPVHPAPSIPKATEQYLWINCPCSFEDLREWRERQS
ncbi:MAG: hypothetical protein OEM00_06850 [Burkholderiaceae bacterium]|nr:hypothetical protein [Burkholderiaceae bacterium]